MVCRFCFSIGSFVGHLSHSHYTLLFFLVPVAKSQLPLYPFKSLVNIMYRSNWSFNILPHRDTLSIWLCIVPGEGGIWRLPWKGGEFDPDLSLVRIFPWVFSLFAGLTDLQVRGASLKRSKYQTRQEYLDILKPKLTFYSLNSGLPWQSLSTATISHQIWRHNLTRWSLINGWKTFPPIVNPL